MGGKEAIWLRQHISELHQSRASSKLPLEVAFCHNDAQENNMITSVPPPVEISELGSPVLLLDLSTFKHTSHTNTSTSTTPSVVSTSTQTSDASTSTPTSSPQKSERKTQLFRNKKEGCPAVPLTNAKMGNNNKENNNMGKQDRNDLYNTGEKVDIEYVGMQEVERGFMRMIDFEYA